MLKCALLNYRNVQREGGRQVASSPVLMQVIYSVAAGDEKYRKASVKLFFLL